MADERAKKIKLMLFDVDGVMTDGTNLLFPAPGGGTRRDTHEHRLGHQATSARRKS